jgi:hypothetical protein
MSAEAVEAFLAKLLVDQDALALFQRDRHAEARRAGLSPDECEQIAAVDLAALTLAAASARRKRRAQAPVPARVGGSGWSAYLASLASACFRTWRGLFARGARVPR